MRKRTEETKAFSVRLKVKTLSKIEKEADERDRSINYIISKVLDDYVKNRKEK